MEFNLINIFASFTAGLFSVASPCVLPVLPIIVTGTEKDSKFRPILIVLGLSITFILMGVISSAFGTLIAGKMRFIEQVSGAVIIIFGVLLLIDINIFKGLTFVNKLQGKTGGNISGFILGLTLGIIWIPCIGPILSSILTMVAAKGNMFEGVILLSVYSIGFSIPMLIVGYSSGYFRQKIKAVQSHPLMIRVISGLILILFGIYIIAKGLVNFSI